MRLDEETLHNARKIDFNNTNGQIETRTSSLRNLSNYPNGKKEISFKDWYKKRYKTEPPHFLDQEFNKSKFDIDEYLKSVLGKEPYVNNAKRRWRFLNAFSRLVYEKKSLNFDAVIRWFAKNCEVMKPRTIKEGYIEFLETLGIIEWNENSKIVNWKGETFKFD